MFTDDELIVNNECLYKIHAPRDNSKTALKNC